MSKTALVILANGFEELEAVGPIDILRRADVQVTVAAYEDHLVVIGRNRVAVLAEILLEAAFSQDYDLIVLPGGPGHATLRHDPRVIEAIQKHCGECRLIAAICAAPTILHEAGLLEGRQYTAHHTVADELPAIIEDKAVVIDGNIITSRGAGTATEFGLALVEQLLDAQTAEDIAESIHLHPDRQAAGAGRLP